MDLQMLCQCLPLIYVLIKSNYTFLLQMSNIASHVIYREYVLRQRQMFTWQANFNRL